jgi:3-hydroxy-3-methylglutaryl CoA synthase
VAARGILAHGAYVPLLRLQRSAVAAANAWANPALKALGRGERSICNWDEDSLTMAVEAARDCLAAAPGLVPERLWFASTTAPFADRSNAGLVAAALALPESVLAQDSAGSLRAATSTLRLELESREGTALVAASDHRLAKPGSVAELAYGDAAAALLVGEGDPVAEYLGGATVSRDLVDHYRAAGVDVDYSLEDRWVRDEGWLKIVPDAVGPLLERLGVPPSTIARFVFPGPRRIGTSLAKRLGLPESSPGDGLDGRLGHSGAAHPALLLAHALENAGPGELVLALGFGQGADALLFRTTPRLRERRPPRGVGGSLGRGRADDNYLRFLSFNGHVSMDWGIRAERDNRTALSTFYRKRDAITGFVGGRCTACGTVQFPRSLVCVHCRTPHAQEDHRFADSGGRVKSFTEDWQAHTPSPPLQYGNVTFEEGGNLMMEFTDCPPGALSVGMPMRMMFRIKDIDERRAFRRYFWKPAPAEAS